jgi:hypothetical protein
MLPLINESSPSFLSRSMALTDTADIGDAEAATNTQVEHKSMRTSLLAVSLLRTHANGSI